MKRIRPFIIILLAVAAGPASPFIGCSPPKAEPVKTVTIPDGEYDPAVWGKAYPLEYDSWLKSKEPNPANLSKYKRGWTGDGKFDKLSEYPWLPMLQSGWGFAIEFNEIRGHYYMLIDQLEVDPSRRKAGGVCLTCKTPYAPQLEKKMGKDYFSKPYKDVVAEIPKEHQDLGVACIDCHDNKDMSLKLSRGFTLSKALKTMGVDEAKLTSQEKRSLVCAQCHVTYTIPKDADMKSVDVFFPWEGSKWGTCPSKTSSSRSAAILPTANGNNPSPVSSWPLSAILSLRCTPTTVSIGRPAFPVPTVICRTPRWVARRPRITAS